MELERRNKKSTSTDQVTLTEVFAESMGDDLLVPLSVHLAGESSAVGPPALPLPGLDQTSGAHLFLLNAPPTQLPAMWQKVW